MPSHPRANSHFSYPIFLRLILWTIWSLLRFVPATSKVIEYRVTLRFLLDHPRRCYTNLFQSRQTWWLLASLISLNAIDWVAFEVLNVCITQSSSPQSCRHTNTIDRSATESYRRVFLQAPVPFMVSFKHLRSALAGFTWSPFPIFALAYWSSTLS